MLSPGFRCSIISWVVLVRHLSSAMLVTVKYLKTRRWRRLHTDQAKMQVGGAYVPIANKEKTSRIFSSINDYVYQFEF